MNKTIYWIFTIGLLLSIILMLAGYIYALTVNQDLEQNLNNFIPDSHSFIQAFNEKQVSSYLLLNTGLMVLSLTPVAGVIYALFYFLSHRQYRFMTAAAAILLVLAAGIIIGFTI
ncbi:MAG: DUF1634 domain-containing protein [Actinomycetia bacterium]|nr:DUF1634 domain-containing protein [Actinomycetes bacterium]